MPNVIYADMVEMQHIETTVTQMMGLEHMNTEDMSQELQKPLLSDHQDHHQATQMAGHFNGNAEHPHIMPMEMMSIAMTNFPVAFFQIDDIYQFFALLSLSLIASFCLEYFSTRRNESSSIKCQYCLKKLSEKSNKLQPSPKQTTSKIVGSNGTNFDCWVNYSQIPSKFNGEQSKLSSFQLIIQFLLRFLKSFGHYTLMIVAMANLWLLIFICLGAALGWLAGHLRNSATRSMGCDHTKVGIFPTPINSSRSSSSDESGESTRQLRSFSFPHRGEQSNLGVSEKHYETPEEIYPTNGSMIENGYEIPDNLPLSPRNPFSSNYGANVTNQNMNNK